MTVLRRPGETVDQGPSTQLKELASGLCTPNEQEAGHASRIFQTADAKEGPLAFKERRDPVWKAR